MLFGKEGWSDGRNIEIGGKTDVEIRIPQNLMGYLLQIKGGVMDRGWAIFEPDLLVRRYGLDLEVATMFTDMVLDPECGMFQDVPDVRLDNYMYLSATEHGDVVFRDGTVRMPMGPMVRVVMYDASRYVHVVTLGGEDGFGHQRVMLPQGAQCQNRDDFSFQWHGLVRTPDWQRDALW